MLILPDEAQWRSRKVRYYKGDWNTLQTILPEFDLVPFRAGEDEPPIHSFKWFCVDRCPQRSARSQSGLSLTHIRSLRTGRSPRYAEKHLSTRELILTVSAMRSDCLN